MFTAVLDKALKGLVTNSLHLPFIPGMLSVRNRNSGCTSCLEDVKKSILKRDANSA
ncbi:MAG: hypothetical protein QOE55_3780 [Acidobacteriaceae bacterium]|nr:hypothetical protein [Acidobacteriaceae bacterium]